MISAKPFVSWKSKSDSPCNSSARSVKVVRRKFLNAFSARVKRFSISASSKDENSFSFSPVAGLMEAIAMQFNKRGPSICHPERVARGQDAVEKTWIYCRGLMAERAPKRSELGCRLDFAWNDRLCACYSRN